MQVDRERVTQKTGFVKEQTTALRGLVAEKGIERILADPWLLKAVKYTLQTAVEACIDLIYHLCAKGLGQAPTDARDGLTRLGKAGILTEDDLTGYSAMIGFRNRMVHGYQEVSNEQIGWILRDELDDLDRFAAITIEQCLKY